MSKHVKLVKCPHCGRVFVDQLEAFGRGYVFPLHCIDASSQVARATCPGSRKPIVREHRVEIERGEET